MVTIYRSYNSILDQVFENLDRSSASVIFFSSCIMYYCYVFRCIAQLLLLHLFKLHFIELIYDSVLLSSRTNEPRFLLREAYTVTSLLTIRFHVSQIGQPNLIIKVNQNPINLCLVSVFIKFLINSIFSLYFLL